MIENGHNKTHNGLISEYELERQTNSERIGAWQETLHVGKGAHDGRGMRNGWGACDG